MNRQPLSSYAKHLKSSAAAANKPSTLRQPAPKHWLHGTLTATVRRAASVTRRHGGPSFRYDLS